MKQRPRRAENGAAAELSVWFEKYGLAPVERQPIIGRTGPDLTLNELELVIDNKSRKKVPDLAVITTPEIIRIGPSFLGVRIRDLDLLLTDMEPRQVPGSVTVADWWLHMDEWRRSHKPNGISCLVLHKPVDIKGGKRTQRQAYADATFVIKVNSREVLNERITSLRRDRELTVHPGDGGSAEGGGGQ